jgi:hypothetical protein
MKKVDIWRWIERAVLIGAVAGTLLSKRADKATYETKLNTLIENDEKRTEYWNNQNTINGKFIILYDYFITGGPGPTESP